MRGLRFLRLMLMRPEEKTDRIRKGRDRPFPWVCANCLKDEVYPVTVPYTTDVKHDGRMYKLTIPALTIPKCRACGELVFSLRVDDQIVAALRAEARLLTPEQIRQGREALGLQSKELAERLGVAKETLSRWETGMMIQSRAMDNFLRVYFAVPQVRAVLLGPDQDPELGTKRPKPRKNFVDAVREYCRAYYIEPARRRGDATVSIRAGDVHAAMGYTSRQPLVCSAIGANVFEETCGVERLSMDGPLNGANATFTFRLL